MGIDIDEDDNDKNNYDQVYTKLFETFLRRQKLLRSMSQPSRVDKKIQHHALVL